MKRLIEKSIEVVICADRRKKKQQKRKEKYAVKKAILARPGLAASSCCVAAACMALVTCRSDCVRSCSSHKDAVRLPSPIRRAFEKEMEERKKKRETQKNA